MTRDAAGNVRRLDETLLRQLYATPPDEFVAARNAAVKELKAAGDRDAASAVGAMRRGSWVDWALNAVAVDEPELVERFVDAAAEMRAAQHAAIRGQSGTDVRAAIGELRERSAELAKRADKVLTGHKRSSALADLTERLAGVAADEEAAEHLRLGRLHGDTGSLQAFFGDADLTTAPSRPTKQRASKEDRPAKRRTTPTTDERGDGESTAKERARQIAAQRQRLERQAKEAERAHRHAVREAERADTAVEKARAAVDAAREKLEAARAELERAEQALTDAESERDTTAEAAQAAERELEDARQAIEDLDDR